MRSCFLTIPTPSNPRANAAVRALRWFGLTAHVISIGQSCLFIQISDRHHHGRRDLVQHKGPRKARSSVLGVGSASSGPIDLMMRTSLINEQLPTFVWFYRQRKSNAWPSGRCFHNGVMSFGTRIIADIAISEVDSRRSAVTVT